MNFPSEQMLYRVIEGDEAAFSQIYTHFRSPAIKFCTMLLKDPEEAENVTQEVFAKIWDRRVQIKPDFSFQSYLFVSLRNQIFDQMRKLEKDQVSKTRYMEKMQNRDHDCPQDREKRYMAVEDAVNALSDRRKKIFKLNVEDGKSYKEIANFLNISTNTVKNQLIRAKQILRQQVSLERV